MTTRISDETIAQDTAARREGFEQRYVYGASTQIIISANYAEGPYTLNMYVNKGETITGKTKTYKKLATAYAKAAEWIVGRGDRVLSAPEIAVEVFQKFNFPMIMDSKLFAEQNAGRIEEARTEITMIVAGQLKAAGLNSNEMTMAMTYALAGRETARQLNMIGGA